MNKKTISLISYLTIIGWIIAFVLYHNGGRSALAQYHLKQSFGLGVVGAVLSTVFIIIFPTAPVILTLFAILCICLLIVLLFGIMNAVKQKRKPLPLIGFLFVDRFHFIKY